DAKPDRALSTAPVGAERTRLARAVSRHEPQPRHAPRRRGDRRGDDGKMDALRRLDTATLVRDQLALDRARTPRFPHLLARKIERMRASATGFLRGAAPLYYQILAERPDLADGPPGEGWLAGDLHLENFGAYRPEDDRVAFDINDFDDAIVGPWRFD